MSYHQDFYSIDATMGGSGGQPQEMNFDYSSFTNDFVGSSGVSSKPSIFDPTQATGMMGSTSSDPYSTGDDPNADEPPLLEELGINFDQIVTKTIAVINPLKSSKIDANILHDSDLAGPLVFALAFGCFLLLSGKVSFGYIYGIGLLGTLPPDHNLSVSCAVSVLGYCLLPMVLLSGMSVLINLNNGIVGTVLVAGTVGWCSISASKLFVTALSMHNQLPLVLYPCVLLYGVFALLTVF